ncbi:MAG: hypothetical protein TV41_04145 [Wolbachia endosymbiont of Dactylopius coccus]|nr:MAG: hypothetical protein TV41_04145 [Wolbachia endosymbiont of Dactylopius coccus]
MAFLPLLSICLPCNGNWYYSICLFFFYLSHITFSITFCSRSNDKSKKPKEKKLTKSRKKPTPSNSQPEDERGSKSPDSGHESDDNEKSKPTSPLHSVPKAGKPLVPPKTAGLQTKSEASPAAQANNVDSVNSEVQKPFQVQSVVDRGKRK